MSSRVLELVLVLVAVVAITVPVWFPHTAPLVIRAACGTAP